MKKAILLGLVSLMSLTGCTLNMNQEITNHKGVSLDNKSVIQENKRDIAFVKNNKKTIEFINQIDWNNNQENQVIRMKEGLVCASITEEESSSDIKLGLVKKIDAIVAPGIYDFVESGIKNSKGMAYQSKVINNVAVTIIPNIPNHRGEPRVKIKMNSLEPKDPKHIEILRNINTEGFMMTGPYVGESKEIIELSTPAFINENEDTYYGDNGRQKIKEANSINYKIYIENGEISSIRMVIDKMDSDKVDNQYLQPFYDLTKLMGIEESNLLEHINENKKTKKKGKIGDYQYRYTRIKGERNLGDIITEIVISK